MKYLGNTKMNLSFSTNILALSLLASSGESFVGNTLRPFGPQRCLSKYSVEQFGLRLPCSSGRTAPLFSSTTENQPTDSSSTTRMTTKGADNNVSEMKERANRLRHEVEELEAEQQASIRQKVRKVFNKFDTDNSGDVNSTIKDLRSSIQVISQSIGAITHNLDVLIIFGNNISKVRRIFEEKTRLFSFENIIPQYQNNIGG